MSAVGSVTGRIQAAEHSASLLASSGFKGTPVAPVAVRRTQRSAALRRMSTTKIQAVAAEPALQRPDDTGRFGRFGGKYVPETLITALAELEQAYAEAINDPAFTVSCRHFGAGFLLSFSNVWLWIEPHQYPHFFAGGAR